MQQYIWYLLIIMAVPAVLAIVLPAGAVKKIAGTTTLVVASLVVLLFLGTIMAGGGRVLKSSAGISADKAELQLRLTYAVQVGMEELVSRMHMSQAEKNKLLAETGDQTSTFEMSEESLAEAITRGDESPVLKAKIAILLYEKELYRTTHPPRPANPLMKSVKAHKPKAQLPEHLRDPMAIARVLETDKDPKIAALGKALTIIFENKRISESEINALTASIETGLPFGWYRDNLLRLLFTRTGGTAQLRDLIAERDSVYLRTFLGAIFVIVTAAVSTIIGCIVILVELVLMARVPAVKEDDVGLDVDMFTLYKVFIAWFCTQAAISLTLQHVVKGGLKLTPDPMTMGIVTAITYMIANIPGLLYIYYFALKPRGLKFWDALKFRTRTSTAGPGKLVLAGYLGWCAAFPLVMLTALIAGFFMNSQGSENPVISQIMLAANAPNPIVILLFYLTIAVLAPICEETMFRGFIYGSLRKRMGVPVAVMCSAMIFGLVHFDKGGILGLIAIGIVLAYVFERTRSLLSCMITHGLWNGAMFTATLILFGTR